MEILLTILTVFAVWALLGVLAVGLLLTLKSLQSIRGWLEKVVTGIRASEQQMAPLGARVDALPISIREATAAIAATRAQLDHLHGELTAGGRARRRETRQGEADG